jgi:hypothetical protein
VRTLDAALPVWLLDVDGVLNASRPGWGGPPRTRNAVSNGVGYRIRWSPALLDRVRALHLSGRVEIHWCTTWCPDADQLEALFGLPSLPRAWSTPLFDQEAATAKLAAAREVLASGRALVWTDDTEVPLDGPVREELLSAGPALLLRPTPTRGLQPGDLDAIDVFLDSVAAAAAAHRDHAPENRR